MHPLFHKYMRGVWLQAMKDLIRGRSMMYDLTLVNVEIIAGKNGHWASNDKWSGIHAYSSDAFEGVVIRGFSNPSNNADRHLSQIRSEIKSSIGEV